MTGKINTNWITWALAGFLTAYLSMTIEANKLRTNYFSEDKYWRINFGKQYFTNPILYAVIAVIIFKIVLLYFPQQMQQYWVIGAIIGIIIPTIKMINNYAIDVYDVTPQFLYAWDVMVYMLFYLLVIGPILDKMDD